MGFTKKESGSEGIAKTKKTKEGRRRNTEIKRWKRGQEGGMKREEEKKERINGKRKKHSVGKERMLKGQGRPSKGISDEIEVAKIAHLRD